MMKKNFKKKLYLEIFVGLLVCCISVFTSNTLVFAQGASPKIKVLNNQQQEINEVLTIKNIDKLQNITDILWIDEKRLICVENVNGVTNLLIYNSESKEITRLTDFKDKYHGRFFIAGLDKKISYSNNNYIVYTEAQPITHEKFLYSLNTNDYTIKKIAEDIYDTSRVDNDRVVYLKDCKLTLVNLCTGASEVIQLPKELYNKLSSPACTFEEFVTLMAEHRGPTYDDEKEWYIRKYDYKMSKFIEKVDLKDNKLLIRDLYFEGYSYILDLQTKKYINERESSYFQAYDTKRIEVGPMTLSGRKLWELNEKGDKSKLIDEGMISSINLSEDSSKLLYEVQQNGKGTTYIYDFDSGKKVVLYLETNSRVFWNIISNRLAYVKNIFEGDSCVSTVVNVIIIN